jgi:murein DD-endopeptidase MepM/ murein hydrolase activator NlpD
VSGDAVDAVVPAGAASGPITILDAGGSASRTTGKTVTVASPERAAKAAGGPDARVDVRRIFFRGAHRATLSVFVPGTETRHVVVDLLRDSDRKAVGHWELDVPGSTVQSVSWSGVVGGTVQRDGVYRFQVTATAPGASAAQSDAVASAFTFLGDLFPIRGKHDLAGGSSGRFGAGRGGRSHQGQDVFAACGTPLVAARGGKVKFRDFQSAAGNYVVIDAAGTGVDYAYMHLKAPALVQKGDTVYTGQPIGEVGDTGDAVGCHLHFELWSSPGWYTGGSPFDPLPALKRWDASS